MPLTGASSLALVAEKQNAHSDRVTSVAFSPDGKTIVSGSYDNTLKVWGALAALAPAHAQPSVHILLPLTGASSLALVADKQNAHSNVVSSVAFSPDGKTIVSGSWDKSIKAWGALAALAPCTSSHQLTPSCLLQVLHP